MTSRRHGRPPTSRELLYIANDAALQSRTGKDPGPVDWDALAARWDTTFGGELAGIAPAVSNARGPDARAPARDSGREPCGPPSRQAQARALAKALVLVSGKHPAWTRHDLLNHLALVMPPETRRMDPAAAQELLLGLAEEAISGRTGEVVCLEAPEWPPLPRSLRRELDGAASTRGPASPGTPPPRSCPWRTNSSRRRKRRRRRGLHASWRRAVWAPTRSCWRRSCAARRTTRAARSRSAGCGWTRPPRCGTC